MLQKVRLYILIMIMVLLFSACPGMSAPALGSPQSERDWGGRAIMVVVDRITWDDLMKADAPVMKKLALTGVCGLMTTNPAAGGSREPENTYATIGAGTKILGGSSGDLGLNLSEPMENDTAGHAYFRRTGIRAGNGQVVHLGIAEMEKVNHRQKYGWSIGSIGTVLHDNGLKTAVLGNADLPDSRSPQKGLRRQVASISMDVNGITDFGDVSDKTYRPDPGSPAGVRTNFTYILNEVVKLGGEADFIVIETGDTSRISEKAPVLDDKVMLKHRYDAIKRVDDFLGRLLGKIDLENDMLLIVVPGPPGEAIRNGNLVTPFIMAGKGVEQGLAWSGTVKRPGLIANVDIASAVIAFFDLPGKTERDKDPGPLFTGQAIRTRDVTGSGTMQADALSALSRLNEDLVFTAKARKPLVRGYLNIELIVIAVCALAVGLRRPLARRAVPLLAALTAVPGVLLCVNLLPRYGMLLIIIEVITVTAVITFLAVKLFPVGSLAPFAVTTGMTVLLIIADLFAGTTLGKTSPMSYDPMAGARFYGIGNEYMGVLIGAALVFSGLLLDTVKNSHFKWLKLLLAPLYIMVILAIAAPALGTNAGGAIAAVAGMSSAGLILFGSGINKRTVLAVSAAVILSIICFTFYDLTRAVEAQTHIGRAVGLINENGFTEIRNIISRKLAVNLRLLKSTTWSWFFFTCILAILLLKKGFPGKYEGFRKRYPWFNKVLTPVIIASFAALAFNDSGIVAAATMITYAVAPFLAGLALTDKKVL
ncbi:hypothetical protein [Phosphitispora fastidiosa]|uniref:hypothetical protein n=1 Tax=Phosphitispora fastidiosa TaxID=2837202 RepID=UPI001E33E2AF|nr:hypothetical protein [Phosphitispora fastidiosa]MBU7005518.1 hypothetical protein [Phosphitispora fastidiosa]